MTPGWAGRTTADDGGVPTVPTPGISTKALLIRVIRSACSRLFAELLPHPASRAVMRATICCPLATGVTPTPTFGRGYAVAVAVAVGVRVIVAVNVRVNVAV